MKKLITTTIFAIAFMMNLNAQSTDGFFAYKNSEDYRTEIESWSTMPSMINHGLTSNQDANVPIGGGLLLLAGMGLTYGIIKCLSKTF